MAGKPGFTRRLAAGLADEARDRATIARRKAAAKLLGHRRHCPDCGKTARTADQVTKCRARHKQERARKNTGPARTRTGPAKPPAPRMKTGYGKHTCGCGNRSCKGTYRNHLEFSDHARQNAEREAARRSPQGGTGPAHQSSHRPGPARRPPQRHPENPHHQTPHPRRQSPLARPKDADGRRSDRTVTAPASPTSPSPRKVQPRVRVAPSPR